MEAARVELDEEDGFTAVLDVQIDALRKEVARTLIRKNSSGSPPSTGNEKPASTNTPISPPASTQSDNFPKFIKFPKSELQTEEEMRTCISELRRWVDILLAQREIERRQLSEERARRLAAEAELLASRVHYDRPPYADPLCSEDTNGPVSVVSETSVSPVNGSPLHRPNTNTSRSLTPPCTSANESNDVWFDAPTM